MAKRVNTRFLVLLTLSVAFFAALAVAGKLLLRRPPPNFVAAGDQAAAAGHWDEAAGDYARALSLGHNQPDVFIRFGTAVEHRVTQDPKALAEAQSAYENALVADPRSLPAAQHLMNLLVALTQVDASQALLSKLRESAARLATLDPSDTRAAAWQQIAVVMQYEAGTDVSKQTLNEAMTALESLSQKNSSDSDLLHYLAGGKLFLATQAMRAHDPEQTSKLCSDAVTLFDRALAARPEDASVNWRAAAAYARAGMLDPENAVKDRNASDAALARAHQLAKPEDPHYADIEIAAAVAAAAHNKPDEAETILRHLLAKFPGSAPARLELASFLGRTPARREEAVALLNEPIVGNGEIGVAGLQIRGQESMRLIQLSHLQIDACRAADDPAAKRKLLQALDGNLTLLTDMSRTESVPVLRIKAAIQEIKGQQIDAMATLRRALTLMEHGGSKDPDLMFQAALLDIEEGQSGGAQKLLQEVVALNPDSAGPQLALADLYLRENNAEQAAVYLDAAERLLPNSPDIPRLRIKQFTAMKQPEGARPYYLKLPEGSNAEKFEKARDALLLNDYVEAARLSEAVHSAAPEDAFASSFLAQIYLHLDQKDRARQVIVQGLDKHPTDIRLLALRARLDEGNTPHAEQIDGQVLAATDEFTREFLSAQLDASHGQFESAARHLSAADALRPNDKQVRQEYFRLFIAQKRWDLAEKEIATLAKLDADGAGGMIYRVRLAMARGDRSGAIQEARELVSARPDFAESFTLLGQALALDGQFRLAAHEYETALDRQHNNYEALAGLANAYLRLDAADKAGPVIATARKLFPNSATFREMSLDYDLFHSPEPEKVVAARAQLLQSNPTEPRAYTALALAALHVAQEKQQTDAEGSKQYLEQASATLEKAIAQWPQDLSIAGLLAQVRQYRGDHAGGEKLLLDLAGSPAWASKPEPQQLLCDFYSREGKNDAAVAALRSAYDKSGHSVDLELSLGRALAQQRKFDDALELFKDNAADSRVVRQRLETQLAAGRTEEAEAGLRHALAVSPGSLDLLNMLTQVYLSSSRFPEARQAAKEALAADPTNNDALYHLALIELRAGDGDLGVALRNATQLKDQNPSSASARGLLADVYDRRGEPDDAIHTLEEGLSLAPNDRELRLRLLAEYAGASPPRWDAYDSVVKTAEGDPRLSHDVVWMEKDAMGLAARERFTAALSKIDGAIAAAPDNLDLASDKLSILLNAREYQEAIQSADRLIADQKKEWWVYLARGIANAQTDKSAGLKDLDESLAAAPDFPAAARVLNAIAGTIGNNEAVTRAAQHGDDPAWRLLEMEYQMKGADYQGAIGTGEALRRGSAKLSYDQQQTLLRALSQAYQTVHRPAEARDAYLQLLQARPNDILTLNNLANVIGEELHQPMDAVVYSQRAYDLTRKEGERYQADVQDTHGWMMTLCGGRNAQTGLSILQRVVEDHQDLIDARYHLGEAYLRNAMPADAQKELQAALEQCQKLEAAPGKSRPELKAAITDALARAKQAASLKADVK